MRTSEVRLNTFLYYDMATSLWRPGSGKWWFERKWSPKGSDTIRKYGLVDVGVAMLQKVSHHGGGL